MSTARVILGQSPKPMVLGPDDPDWYRHTENLWLLFKYLEEHGVEYGRASDVLEKPWKWSIEFRAALKWRELEVS